MMLKLFHLNQLGLKHYSHSCGTIRVTQRMMEQARRFFGNAKDVEICRNYELSLKRRLNSLTCVFVDDVIEDTIPNNEPVDASEACLESRQSTIVSETPKMASVDESVDENSYVKKSCRGTNSSFLLETLGTLTKNSTQYRKSIGKVNGKVLRNRIDLGIAQLAILSGVDNISYVNRNHHFLSEILCLIQHIKIRLMFHTGFDIDEINNVDSSSDDDVESTTETPPENKHNSTPTPQDFSNPSNEFQSFLFVNLPRDKFNHASKMVNDLFKPEEKFSSNFVLKNKSMASMLKTFSFTNSEYIEENKLSEKSSENGIGLIDFHRMDSSQLAPVIETNMNHRKNMKKGINSMEFETEIPKICYGAYIAINDCLMLFEVKVRSVLKNLPCDPVPYQKATKNALIIGCCDGAVHDNLPEHNRNILTYSITVVSRFLIENCSIYPTTSNWIITHAQSMGKETTMKIHELMKFRYIYLK